LPYTTLFRSPTNLPPHLRLLTTKPNKFPPRSRPFGGKNVLNNGSTQIFADYFLIFLFRGYVRTGFLYLKRRKVFHETHEGHERNQPLNRKRRKRGLDRLDRPDRLDRLLTTDLTDQDTESTELSQLSQLGQLGQLPRLDRLPRLNSALT